MPVHDLKNLLLQALSADSLARLKPLLRSVDLPHRKSLYQPGQRIDNVYFPESGWLSMIATFEDGEAAEVGLIGREGVVGLPIILGAEADEVKTLVQCPGIAHSLPSDVLIAAMNADRALHITLLHYAQVHHSQVVRTAACNSRHPIEQRLARWLLMADDRNDGKSFPMTHDFLSMMLGVRRSGISIAMSALQKAQFIQYERGRIKIVDRPGLESASCDCYELAKKVYARVSLTVPSNPHVSSPNQSRA